MKNTLTLDISKWRCGADTKKRKNRKGRGGTALLNPQGFMCCLGQFSCQLGLPEEDLIDESTISDVVCILNVLHKNFKCKSDDILDSLIEIEDDLININDSSNTTIEEKISLIREKLKEEDIKLRVIQEKPKTKKK